MARVQGEVRFEALECGERRVEMSVRQRAEYGRAMRGMRWSYGMTDGLKLNQADFQKYLEDRRAADAEARGWK